MGSGEVSEPADRPPRKAGKTGWSLTLLLMAVGVTLAVVLAPEDWRAGPAVLEVSERGRVLAEVPVALGSETPVEVRHSSGLTVAIPSGLRLDAPIEVDLQRANPPLAPAGVRVEIVWPDGAAEALQVLDDGDGLKALRRPPNNVALVMAILAAALVLWITELVPLFVTSLAIPVVLVMAEVGQADDALAPFFDPIIVLFFAGFLLARALQRSGLERRFAVEIVAAMGGSPIRLYLALIALAAFLSMWMSNTAAVTVLMPIAMAVTEPIGSASYRKAAVLGIAYAATIGGVGSLIGTPANLIAVSFLERLSGREISFAEWFGFGLPVVVIFLPLMAAYLWFISRVRVDRSCSAEAAEQATAHRQTLGPISRAEGEVLAVFGAVMATWLTQTYHGVNPGIVALAGAVALFAMGRIEVGDLGRISWPTLLTFGGGLTLGLSMVESGTSDWLATQLGALEQWPRLPALAVVALVALGLTTMASNTASAAALIPLAVPLAGLLGIDPVVLVIVVAIATSVDFALVIGTPPTMMAYSTGVVSTREILRKGSILDLIGIAVLILVAMWVWPPLGLSAS